MSRMQTVLRNAIWSIASTAADRLTVISKAILSYEDDGAGERPDRLAARFYDGSTWAADGAPQSAEAQKVVAVLPMTGVLDSRGEAWMESYGLVLMDRWMARFNALVANDRVAAIVIDIDSPGGSVFGVTEAARAVFASRGSKPIIAVANPQAASAAYYMAAAADEIVMPVSAEVGSVGTVAVHLDISKALDEIGFKWTVITAGKYKWEASPDKPLSDEARDFIQKRVNDYYGLFTGDLKKFRKEAKVKPPSDFGGGRMYGAADAIEMGLADRIASLDDVVFKLAEKLNKASRRTAARAALANV